MPASSRAAPGAGRRRWGKRPLAIARPHFVASLVGDFVAFVDATGKAHAEVIGERFCSSSSSSSSSRPVESLSRRHGGHGGVAVGSGRVDCKRTTASRHGSRNTAPSGLSSTLSRALPITSSTSSKAVGGLSRRHRGTEARGNGTANVRMHEFDGAAWRGTAKIATIAKVGVSG